jgi:hypothetical protein
MSEVERLRHTATRSKAFAVGSCLYPRAHKEVVLEPRKLLLEYPEAQELESKTRGLPESGRLCGVVDTYLSTETGKNYWFHKE